MDMNPLWDVYILQISFLRLWLMFKSFFVVPCFTKVLNFNMVQLSIFFFLIVSAFGLLFKKAFLTVIYKISVSYGLLKLL